MAPTVVLDAAGPPLAIGAAGGTRLRTALVSVLAGILDEGLIRRMRSIGRASTPRATRSTRSPAWTSARCSSSRSRAGMSCAGTTSTTTSAA